MEDDLEKCGIRTKRWEGTDPPDEAVLRAELAAEGYSVYAWTDAPGTSYPAHSHDEDQSHWILRGALALSAFGKEYILRAGDRDWLPSGTVHTARVVGDGPVTYLIAARSRPRS